MRAPASLVGQHSGRQGGSLPSRRRDPAARMPSPRAKAFRPLSPGGGCRLAALLGLGPALPCQQQLWVRRHLPLNGRRGRRRCWHAHSARHPLLHYPLGVDGVLGAVQRPAGRGGPPGTWVAGSSSLLVSLLLSMQHGSGQRSLACSHGRAISGALSSCGAACLHRTHAWGARLLESPPHPPTHPHTAPAVWRAVCKPREEDEAAASPGLHAQTQVIKARRAALQAAAVFCGTRNARRTWRSHGRRRYCDVLRCAALRSRAPRR